MNIRRTTSLYALLLLVIFILDRLTKTLILNSLTDRYEILPFLSCDLALNRGISWGMLHTSDPMLFALVTFIVMCITMGVIAYAYARLKEGLYIVGEVMVIAGSLSNIVDRFVYRGVIDFILISCGDWHFPLFNIADVSIVVGVAIMIIMSYKES